MGQLKAMLKSMETDSALFKEFGRLINADDDAAIMTLAKEKGFSITADDLQSYKEFVSEAVANENSKQQLGEEKLEDVTGGNGEEYGVNMDRTKCLGVLVGKVEFKNGEDRKKCNAWSCFAPTWSKIYTCKCFKTTACIDNWHSTSSHASH